MAAASPGTQSWIRRSPSEINHGISATTATTLNDDEDTQLVEEESFRTVDYETVEVEDTQHAEQQSDQRSSLRMCSHGPHDIHVDFRGLSHKLAAQRLCGSVRDTLKHHAEFLQKHDNWKHVATHHLCTFESILTMFAIVLLILDFFIRDGCYPWTNLAVSAVLGVCLGGHVYLLLRRAATLKWEATARMRRALYEFEAATVHSSFIDIDDKEAEKIKGLTSGNNASTPASGRHVDHTGVNREGKQTRLYGDALLRAVQPLTFHSTHEGITSYLTYRSGEWLRLPLHCLVKGDVVALKPGEISPATVRCVDDPFQEGANESSTNPDSHNKAPPVVVPSGYRIPCLLGSLLVKQTTAPGAHRAGSPQTSSEGIGRSPGQRARDLLVVNGDSRRFILLETPLGTLLRQRLCAPLRPRPLFVLHLESMFQVVRVLTVSLLVGSIIAAAVRASTDTSNLDPLPLVFSHTSLMVVCSIPLSFPFLVTIGESWVTAQVLSLQERAMLRWRWKEWKKSLSRKADEAVAAAAREPKHHNADTDILNSSPANWNTGAGSVSISQMRSYLHKHFGIDEKNLRPLKVGRRIKRCCCFQWPEGGIFECQVLPSIKKRYCPCLVKELPEKKRRRRKRRRRRSNQSSTKDNTHHRAGSTSTNFQFITSEFGDDQPLTEDGRASTDGNSCATKAFRCLAKYLCLSICRRKDTKKWKLRENKDIELAAWDAGPYKDARELFIAQCNDVGGVDLYGGLVPTEYWQDEYSTEHTSTLESSAKSVRSILEESKSSVQHMSVSRPSRKRSAPSFQSISMKEWEKPIFWRSLSYFFDAVTRPAEFSEVPALHQLIRRLLQTPPDKEDHTSVKVDANGLVLGDDTVPGLTPPPDVGFGLEPIRTPLLSSQFVLRFGESTSFVCAERPTVCNPELVAEHALFQKGEEGSVIVDLHADDTASHGVRFDDPRWPRYLSALKPMGLAALLNSRYSGAQALPELTDPLTDWPGRNKTDESTGNETKNSANGSPPGNARSGLDEDDSQSGSKVPTHPRKSRWNPVSSLGKMTSKFLSPYRGYNAGSSNADKDSQNLPLERSEIQGDNDSKFPRRLQSISSFQQKAVAVMDADNSTRGLIRLSEAVRDIPVTNWVVNFARSLGFTDHDIDYFAHKRHLYLMSPIPHALPSVARSDLSLGRNLLNTSAPILPSRKDVWPLKNRSMWLNPAMSSTVVRDKRTNKLQMLSTGPLPFVLNHCSDHWDGGAIWPLSKKKKENIMETWKHWQAEDLHCIAISYDPVSNQETSLFRKLDEAATAQANVARTEAAAALRRAVAARRARRQGRYQKSKAIMSFRGSLDEGGGDSESVDTPTDPVVNIDVGLSIDTTSIVLLDGSPVHKMTNDPSSSTRRRRTGDEGKQDSLEEPEHNFAEEAEQRLLDMQDRQIFIGMIASRYQPHAKIQSLIKNLSKAGVRFVYSTARNYFRTRPLANKMGLETGWNCAISLKDRSSEHREDYSEEAGTDSDLSFDADDIMLENDWNLAHQDQRLTKLQKLHEWDFKAQLPHGLSEIREHLVEKDNVPLLVSLYTDATPTALAGMMRIMQENGETVTVVPSTLDRSSPMLCSVANSSVTIDSNETRTDQKLLTNPFFSDCRPSSLMQQEGFNPYLRLSNAAASLSASLSVPPSSVHVLVKTMKFSQAGVANWRQALVFLLVMHVIISLLPLMSVIFFSIPAAIEHVDCLWLTLIIFPALVLSMLSTPPEPLAMTEKRTPFKRDGQFEYYQNVLSPEEASRLSSFKYSGQHCHGCVAHPCQGQKFSTASGARVDPNPDDYTAEPHPEDLGTCSWMTGPSVFFASHIAEIPYGDVSEAQTSKRFSVWSASTGRRLPMKARRQASAKKMPFPSRCFAILIQLVLVSVPTVAAALILYLVHEERISGRSGLSGFSDSPSDFGPESSPVCIGSLARVEALASRISQTTVASLIVLSSVSYSGTMMYRSHHVWKEPPIKNSVWVLICVSCVVLQWLYNEVVAISVISWFLNKGGFSEDDANISTAFPIWLRSLGVVEGAALLGWPIVLIMWTSIVKHMDRKHFERLMLRLRAYFDTRLGMYSPR
eukprot:gb/GECG01014331.1/.p1 GENE.gb/GECG01014331.1/~~gb/GECG01014331.1/.p1  ORF type:complete len:2081 (+),score=192.95 gb/GECG01014331.1/:1-6243(+)